MHIYIYTYVYHKNYMYIFHWAIQFGGSIQFDGSSHFGEPERYASIPTDDCFWFRSRPIALTKDCWSHLTQKKRRMN